MAGFLHHVSNVAKRSVPTLPVVSERKTAPAGKTTNAPRAPVRLPHGILKPAVNDLGLAFGRLKGAVPTCARTMLRAPSNVSVSLPANVVSMDGKRVAIAASAPTRTNLAYMIEAMHKERPSVLVILESDKALGPHPHRRYFDGTLTSAGRIRIDSQCTGTVAKAGEFEVTRYAMQLSAPGEAPVDVPVLHVQDWSMASALSPATMEKLALRGHGVLAFALRTLAAQIDEMAACGARAARANGEAGVPWIQGDRKDVARTGPLVATRAMMRGKDLSLDKIISSVRRDCHQAMLSADPERLALTAIAVRHKVPLKRAVAFPASLAGGV